MDRSYEFFNRVQMKFILIFIAFFSFSSLGIIGSITDPGFSIEERTEKSFFGPLRGSFKTQIFRNIRRKPNKFWFFDDSLSIKNDLSLNYFLFETFPSLKESRIFNETILFFVVSYQRPVYAVIKKINPFCFKEYFCFSDIDLGISNSFLLKNHLKGEYSVYLSLPFISKISLNQKKIIGIGSSLNTYQSLISENNFQLQFISSHFLDIGIFNSRWRNQKKTYYNEIFSLFNQMGIKFNYSKYSFFPVLFIYGNHRFSLNFKAASLNKISVGCSSIWFLSKRLRLALGLEWGDNILKPEGTVQAVDIRFFNPDSTFINGGFSYFF